MGTKRLICEPQAGAKDNLNLNYDTASGGHPWIKLWAQLHTPSHKASTGICLSYSQLLIWGFTDFFVYVL